jgi:hypothetical protein
MGINYILRVNLIYVDELLRRNNTKSYKLPDVNFFPLHC